MRYFAYPFAFHDTSGKLDPAPEKRSWLLWMWIREGLARRPKGKSTVPWSEYLDDVLENGRPRYTQAQKEEVKQSIEIMLDLIHQKDYFTIAKDVKKSRFRPYMMHFLKFADKADEELCASIRKQNVLIIDDVTTSGSTLNEILRTLRILNEDNDITIFSLIGRKDLMAEAF